MRHITLSGLQLIQHFEQFSPKSYVCPGGILTIGYGHAILPSEHFETEINIQEAQCLLLSDLQKAEKAVQRAITISLNDGQFNALVSLTFNIGCKAFAHSTLCRVINNKQHHEITHQFMRWIYCKNQKSNGLMRRRTAEAYMYHNSVFRI